LGEGNLDTIPKVIEAVVKIVLIVGIPIIALSIIYTGFLFVEAQGNPEKITKAKKAFLYTVVGAALLLGAFVIANAIGATVKDITSRT
jgi:Na+-driven multidrug efflux pump